MEVIDDLGDDNEGFEPESSSEESEEESDWDSSESEEEGVDMFTATTAVSLKKTRDIWKGFPRVSLP